MATLYLLCGLPGSGKTTFAKQFALNKQALRLTPDEWMTPLFGAEIYRDGLSARFDELHDRVEKVQWLVAEQALTLGVNVVLDFGVWSRSERDAFRARASELGASCEIVFLDVPLAELKSRVLERNERLENSAYRISGVELEQWWNVFEPPGDDELGPR